MKEIIVYQTSSLYRDDFRVKGYVFGQGEKSLCIVGSLRGHEYQQLYMASQLVKYLKDMENAGMIESGKQILVIPTLNPSSMNISKQFWAIDNTDINRMFPGYDQGETTQRIAAGVFDVVNKYENGIQFSSFYMPGSFMPHVRLTHTGYENLDKAADFGIPYVVVRKPHPYDTTTLNYNWQVWETDAYSLYSSTTKNIDPVSAEIVLDGAKRFMVKNNILREAAIADADPLGIGNCPENSEHSGTAQANIENKNTCKPGCANARNEQKNGEAESGISAQNDEIKCCKTEGFKPRIFYDTEMIPVRNKTAGFYKPQVKPGDRVKKGDVCAEIYDTCNGEKTEELISPADGIIFFQQDEPLVFARTAAVKVLPDADGSSF